MLNHKKLTMTLYGLFNIGKVIELRLNEIGIETYDQLVELGTEEVFLRLYAKNKNTSKTVLFSIEGAIEGVTWREIDPKRREELQKFFDTVTKKK